MDIPVAPSLGRFSVLFATALLASACGGGGGGNNNNTAVPISESDRLVLQVQPIQVCNDGGIVCAQVDFFETIADKIWGQANIDIAFLPLNQLNDSTYLTTDEDEFSDLSFSGDAGDFGRHPDSSRDQGPINLWFVDVIQTGTGLIQFGNAWVGANGVLISDDIFDFNNGAGRIDVIAHEIGHNLGLRHSTFGAGSANNLMTGGGRRTIPDSIDNVSPDGQGLSQLNSSQIARARSSNFLTGTQSDEIFDTLLITEADAIPAEADAIPVSAISASAISASAIPLSASEGSPTILATSSAAIQRATVPESPLSPLTWLLLFPLVLWRKP